MNTDLWTKVLDSLGNTLNKQTFETWLKDTEVLKISDNENTIKIKVPDDVASKHISENYASQISRIIKSYAGKEYSCEFITMNQFEKTQNQNKIPEPEHIKGSEPLNTHFINPKYTFDDFVVGPNNQLANAAAVAVSKAPAKQFNPLFIYGGAGLGKTHLLQAIGNHILEEKPYLKVLYLPTDQFITEFVLSIRTNTMESFKLKYRNIDVLLIDDIQFLEKKEETQNEFFHTFNDLYNNKKHIVITSDKPPKQLATLTDRLKTRFEWGMITDIQPPNIETREAILRNKAEKEGIEIDDEIIIYIAKRIRSNIRALEAALNRLKMVQSLYKDNISIISAKNHLKDLFDDDNNKKISINDIIKHVSGKYSITPEEIVSKTRHSRVILPRFIAMYITRSITGMTTVEIGKNFGDRDHSTVVNAINKIEEDMKKDTDLKETVDDIIDDLKS